ncbi:GyrI-like domain-containing protein [Saccharibacillus kuerlensis]|uniref:AraC effector-binding domain-containing protein n=1 Tax=Saccharibacillus kuerlensis TaxID=459527 RepID=A0ABQ2LAC4_9BACL|nr:effector binding domain-containing protein [Saccharibacillus kuerlensis]GGO08360.1 hypothetical protein GCM10010969_37760 [Saccharibacillus kuerlensis]
MEAKEVVLPEFAVVGLKIEGNLEEFNAGLAKDTYHSLKSKMNEIPNRKNEKVIMIQIYPMKPGFDPVKDRFTQIMGYEVTDESVVPEGMIRHSIPESKYATCTHKGLEADIGQTYDSLYGEWIRSRGSEPKGYDFEVWDERYQPESEQNEIDMFVALR